MKILFINLIIVLCSFNISAQWVEQNSGTSLGLNSVFFINENLGWSVGNNGIILSTLNGGETWSFSQQSNVNRSINEILFINQNIGFIGVTGSDSISGIYKTIDGGNTWLESNIFNMDVLSIKFIDDNIGWAAGSNGKIYKTTNTGDNWFLIDSLGWWIRNIDFISAEIGYIQTTSGLYKSTNGGTNWSIIQSYSGLTSGLNFINENLGWFSSGFVASKSQILKTTNGGIDYAQYEVPFFIHDINFNDEMNGWVIGYDNNISFIYRTTDGGNSWFEQDTISNVILNSLCSINNNLAWIVGSPGKIYKTTNGGGQVTNIEKEETNPTDFILNQNYPNPFNPSTEIRYQITEDSKVYLIVYDILGNEVVTLINEYKAAGSYSVNWNAENLTSGVYLYKLEAISTNGKTNFSSTKKMILQK